MKDIELPPEKTITLYTYTDYLAYFESLIRWIAHSLQMQYIQQKYTVIQLLRARIKPSKSIAQQFKLQPTSQGVKL